MKTCFQSRKGDFYTEIEQSNPWKSQSFASERLRNSLFLSQGRAVPAALSPACSVPFTWEQTNGVSVVGCVL